MFESYKERRRTQAVLSRTLAQVAAVQSGEVEMGPLVTTTKGMVEVTPANAADVTADIRNIWGEAYPDLFDENPRLQRVIRAAEKIGILPKDKAA